jgi:hypothetical protein
MLWLVVALLLPLLGGCRLFDTDEEWEDECVCGYPAIDEGVPGASVLSTPAQVLPGPAR